MSVRVAGEDEIIRLIGSLNRHKDVVARAFREGSISQGSVSDAVIIELRQARILSSAGEQEYRLAPAFQRAIEYALKRSRSFAGNENFAGMVDGMRQLMDSYSEAYNGLRDEDADDTRDQFDLQAFELGELVTERIDFFEMLVENRFADAAGLEAKIRQNRYYIHQAKSLDGSLSELDRREIYADLCDDPQLVDLRLSFERHIQRRRAAWHSNLLEVAQRLQEQLFELQQARPRLNRLRLVAQLFKDNPDFTLPAIESLPETPAWARRFTGLKVCTHPDVSSRQTASALAPLAGKVYLEPAVKAPPRAPVPLAEGGDQAAPQQMVEIGQGREALQRFLLAAAKSKVALRASEWFRDAAPGVDAGAWLLFSIFAVQTRTGVPTALWRCVSTRLIEAERGEAALLGNRVFADIEVASRLPQQYREARSG